MSKDVLIKAPVAIAFQRAPDEFQGDPNDVYKRVIKARYDNADLPEGFWDMFHNCPLCHKTLDAYTFVAHAGGCIAANAPRGKLWVEGFNPAIDRESEGC